MKLFSRFTAEEKASYAIFITSFLIYAVISMTKSAYSASIAVIVQEGMFSKSSAGIINGGFYFFYGLAQVVGLKIVDKISPVKLVYMTLIGTAVLLAGMAMSKSFAAMLVLWSACGLIQFAIWPAVLRVISEFLLPELQSKAKIYISFSYCVGSIINYLVASVALSIAGWELLFWISAAVVAICIVLWAAVVNKNKSQLVEISNINKMAAERFLKEKEKNGEKAVSEMSFGKMLLASGVVFLLVTAFIRTIMDSGLKSWIPTIITDSYNVSAGFASALTTVLLVVNLGGIFIANWMYPKRIKSAVGALGVTLLVPVPLTAFLFFIGNIPLAIVVVLFMLITTMMYSGHQLINVIIPSSFAKLNKAGSVAASLNAVASFGGVIANIGAGIMADRFGWNITLLIWAMLAAVGCVFCFIACPFWKKFFRDSE